VAPAATGQALSVFWLDGMKGNLNQALVSLILFVVFTNHKFLVVSLGCAYVWSASTS